MQREMLAEVAAATGVPATAIPTAVDGCGVVTFAAAAPADGAGVCRPRELDGGDRVAAAMRAHPELIRGGGRPTRC